jgi:hypothetical protein
LKNLEERLDAICVETISRKCARPDRFPRTRKSLGGSIRIVGNSKRLRRARASSLARSLFSRPRHDNPLPESVFLIN